MVEDHKKAIALFEQASDKIADAQVKGFHNSNYS